MTTLTQPKLKSLIDRLFAEADAAEDARWPAAAGDRADCRQYYGQLDQPLPVSRATGTLLYMLARSVRARNIVEFGTSFGISTLHLAAALRDNGGARLIGSEFEPSKIQRGAKTLLPEACLIWWKSVRATRWKRWPAICPIRSILSYSMERRSFIRRCSLCSRIVCAVAHSLSPTTRMRVPNTLRASGPRPTAICRSPSPTTSNCRCGWGLATELRHMADTARRADERQRHPLFFGPLVRSELAGRQNGAISAKLTCRDARHWSVLRA